MIGRNEEQERDFLFFDSLIHGRKSDKVKLHIIPHERKRNKRSAKPIQDNDFARQGKDRRERHSNALRNAHSSATPKCKEETNYQNKNRIRIKTKGTKETRKERRSMKKQSKQKKNYEQCSST